MPDLALLPCVPVRAQDTQRAKPAVKSLDEQIDVLRRALQRLEEQKRKQQG
jgi:hypothetical protein